MSVTYGALGSTTGAHPRNGGAHSERQGIKAAAHLTCVGATREEVDAVPAYIGMRHPSYRALRGDPPEGTTQYTPHPGGYAYGVDLVAGLKRVADFEISVAATLRFIPRA